MSDVTNIEEGEQPVLPEDAIGKLESDPDNPEIKTVKITTEYVVTSDDYVYGNRLAAIQHEEALRDRRKSPR